MKKIFTLLSSSFFSIATFAQTVPLPYNTGFDNAAEKAGWQAFRNGAHTFGVWVYSSMSAVSAPNCLYHDYPVGAPSSDTTEDWFVSPAFDFSNGGKISLKVNLYSFSNSTFPVDEFALYLLIGNADPSLATQTLLASFTHMAASPPVWNDSNDIVIPVTTGNSYIAFKYKTTNNWITPRIDDISIVKDPLDIDDATSSQIGIKIFPNPAKDAIEIDAAEGAIIQSVRLSDFNGKLVKEQKGNLRRLNTKNISTGNYLLEVQTNKGILTEKIMIEQ